MVGLGACPNGLVVYADASQRQPFDTYGKEEIMYLFDRLKSCRFLIFIALVALLILLLLVRAQPNQAEER